MIRKEIILALIYIVSFSLSLFSPLYGLVLLINATFFDKRLILPFVISLPLIETAKIPLQNITLSKVYYAMLILYFLSYISIRKLNIFKNPTSKKILLLIPILFIGFLVGFFHSDLYNSIAENSFMGYLNENASFAGSLIFSILIITYLQSLKKENLQEILTYTLRLLPIGMLIAILFTFYEKSKPTFWYGVMRMTFVGADPNEFSCMLASFICINLYNFYFANNKLEKILNMGIVILSLFTISNITVSKSGIITFIFGALIFYLFMLRSFPKRTGLNVIIFILILAVVINFINLEPIMVRFLGYRQIPYAEPLEYITTGRLSAWAAGLIAFSKNPFLGYGGSDVFERVAIMDIMGLPKVVHNTYISVLLQYGVLGLVIFMLIIFEILKRSRSYLFISHFNIPFFFALISLLFAGFSLNWFKREIIWFLIAINSSIGLKKNEGKTN